MLRPKKAIAEADRMTSVRPVKNFRQALRRTATDMPPPGSGSLAPSPAARLHRRGKQIVAADPGVLVADDGLHRQARGRRRGASPPLDRRPDRHEIDKAAGLVHMGGNAHLVIGPD